MSIGFGAIRETPQFGERTVMIPPGIPQALECLSREVIRNQPDNIVQFAADYFKYLLELRERTGQDPLAEESAGKIDTKFIQNPDAEPLAKSNTFDKVEEGENLDLNDPELNQAAVKIQSNYRGFHTRKELKHKDEPDSGAAPGEGNETSSDAGPAQKGTEGEDLQNFGDITDEEELNKLNNAATAIQSGFKGYQTRKSLKSDRQVVKPESPILTTKDSLSNFEKRNSAASVIQKQYREWKLAMGVGVIAEADVEQTSTASTRELEEPTPEEKGKGKEKPKKGFVIDDDYVEIERHPTATIPEEDETGSTGGSKGSVKKLTKRGAPKTTESAMSSSLSHVHSRTTGTKSASKVHTATSTSVYRNLQSAPASNTEGKEDKGKAGKSAMMLPVKPKLRTDSGEGQKSSRVENDYGAMPAQEPMAELTKPFMTSAPNSEFQDDSDQDKEDIQRLREAITLMKNNITVLAEFETDDEEEEEEESSSSEESHPGQFEEDAVNRENSYKGQPAPVPHAEGFSSIQGARENKKSGSSEMTLSVKPRRRTDSGEGQGLPHVESYYGIMPVQEPVTEVTSHVTRPFVTSSAPNSEYMPESDRSTDDEEEDIEGLPGLSLIVDSESEEDDEDDEESTSPEEHPGEFEREVASRRNTYQGVEKIYNNPPPPPPSTLKDDSQTGDEKGPPVRRASLMQEPVLVFDELAKDQAATVIQARMRGVIARRRSSELKSLRSLSQSLQVDMKTEGMGDDNGPKDNATH